MGGIARPPHNFPVWLKDLTAQVAKSINVSPEFMNCCNVNKYVSASHDCYWHQDDESLFRASELDRSTFIVSLSLGDPKVFSVRVKFANHEDPITLYDGDLYVMFGLFQDKYQHFIKKGQPNMDSSFSSSSTEDKPGPYGVRFNLTWRWQRSHLSKCGCKTS
jgi:alkylated DNA repair dioxygenase AlkB